MPGLFARTAHRNYTESGPGWSRYGGPVLSADTVSPDFGEHTRQSYLELLLGSKSHSGLDQHISTDSASTPSQNVHICAICIATRSAQTPPSSKRTRSNSRLPQWLRNARLDTLDLRRAKASKSALVLWAAEARSHGTLKVSNGSTDGGLAFSAFGGHDGWQSLCLQ